MKRVRGEPPEGALTLPDFRRSFFGRLFLGFAVFVVLSALVLGLFVHSRMRGQALAEVERNLANTSLLLASAEGANPAHLWSDALAMQVREIGQQTGHHVRLVHANGEVAADSRLDPAELPNQRELPEFAAARRFGAALERGDCPESGEPMLYYVRPILLRSDIIGYVRLGVSLAGLEANLRHMRDRVLGLAVLNAGLTLLLGYVVGRFAMRPLARIALVCQRIAAGDLGQKVALRRDDEFGVVAQAIDRMTTELARQILTVTREREQLDRALAENRRLETVRQTFVANVSHELKTPLAAIASMVETLAEAEDLPAADRARFLGRIRAQVDRLNRLVLDLLALSRLESARHETELQPLDLAPLVERAAHLFAPLAKRRGLRLDYATPPDPVVVRGEPEGVRMMLHNLLQNAVHYTPPGGEIRIDLRANAHGGATLAVRDTGIGIAPEHLGRIFERFYRVDRARDRNSGGTGLGLSIVKHVALAHRATVAVESRPGEGSCFRVEFPPPAVDTAPAGKTAATAAGHAATRAAAAD